MDGLEKLFRLAGYLPVAIPIKEGWDLMEVEKASGQWNARTNWTVPIFVKREEGKIYIFLPGTAKIEER